MVRPSQTVSIGELYAALFPRRHGKKFIVILRGYIDESADKRVFTLSCLMARPMDWMWIESKWKKVLREKNKQLRKQGRPQISRYHAADCSSRLGEFTGWTTEEQVAFSKRLLAILKSHESSFVAYSISLDDFVAVYPERAENPSNEMYGLLLKFLMTQIIRDIEMHLDGHPAKPFTIALIHDRSSRDGDFVTAFNQMLDDETFAGREHFVSITPMGWENCIPLQVADLLAYENFKDSTGKMAGRPRRKSFQSLLEPNTLIGGHGLMMGRPAIEKMKEATELARRAREAKGAP